MYLVRDAFRALRAAPVVSAVAILSLALGIGANSAMFSILDSLLLRPLPVEDPQHLLMVGQLPRGRTSWTNPIWEQIRDRQDLFGGALAWSSARFNLSSGGPTEFVDGVWTSGRYFDVLGVRPILGRTWAPEDDRRGGGPDGAVAVISYSYWQRRFGGAADVIGRQLTVERVPFTILGVTPPGFFGVDVGRTFDIAIPLGTEPLIRGKESSLDRRSTWWLNIMVRTRNGQSLEAAQAALRAVQPQIREATMPPDWREEDKQNYLSEALALDSAATGHSGLRSRYQRPLTTIMVVVALVLLIACANIANLLLARATARRHELSVRLALGASRLRLARQLLSESLLLSGIGAVLGLLLARWFSRFLVSQLSTPTNNVYLRLALDWRVIGFTAATTIGTAVLFGTVPALRATRVQPNEAIKEHGRSPAGDGRSRLGSGLVVVQVALSLMLLVAAGLFIRTFSALTSLGLGFDKAQVIVASINLQPLQLEPAAQSNLLERLVDAAASTPGVHSAARSAVTPISGSTWNYRLELLDGKPIELADKSVFVNRVDPRWFETYGTRLVAGRDFDRRDRAGATDVAIVNEAFARKFLGGRNPVGHRVREPLRPSDPTPEREIVGYVADAAYRSLREPVPPTMYLPFRQMPNAPSAMSISVRAASGSPALLTKGLAAALTSGHPGVAITFRPLAEQVNASLTQERVVATLSAFFGGLALLLAGLGLYGVTSYSVARRRAEIGIRMALGAQGGDVIVLVLRRVALLIAIGIVAGSAAGIWASRFVSALLYNLEPHDTVTFAAAAAVLTLAGGIAGLIPAYRASRLDPSAVMREG